MREEKVAASGQLGFDRRDLLLKGGAVAAVAGTVIAGVTTPAAAAPLAPVLLPYGPQRLYDSRTGGGPLPSGYQVTLTSTNPAVDAAFLLNLTIVDTVGSGFVSVFSADISWPGSSTLNWYGAGQINANNAYTAIRQSDQGIKVYAGGGGSTNFVLDLVGRLTLVDLATISSLSSAAAMPSTKTAFSEVHRERL